MLVPVFFQAFYYQTWHRNATRGNNNWSLKKWTIDNFFISIPTGNTYLFSRHNAFTCFAALLHISSMWNSKVNCSSIVTPSNLTCEWLDIYFSSNVVNIRIVCSICCVCNQYVSIYACIELQPKIMLSRSLSPQGADENIACFAHRFIRNPFVIMHKSLLVL